VDRIRVVRTLIYEGPRDWVETTLESEGRFVNGTRIMNKPDTSRIPAEHFGKPIAGAEVPRIVTLSITEYLAPAEVIRG
jgi:hypothetical protein